VEPRRGGATIVALRESAAALDTQVMDRIVATAPWVCRAKDTFASDQVHRPRHPPAPPAHPHLRLRHHRPHHHRLLHLRYRHHCRRLFRLRCHLRCHYHRRHHCRPMRLSLGTSTMPAVLAPRVLSCLTVQVGMRCSSILQQVRLTAAGALHARPRLRRCSR
jgi:hypothetical protein